MIDRVDDTVLAVSYSDSYIAWIYNVNRSYMPTFEVHFVPRIDNRPSIVVLDLPLAKVEAIMELLEAVGGEPSFIETLKHDRCKIIKFVTHKETARYCLCPAYYRKLSDLYPGLGIYRLYYQDSTDPEGQFWGLEESPHDTASTH